MSDLPSITVVTPCLDRAATLERALESVRTQEYPGEVEHVVVDGGSTDGTVEILERAGVRYVSEPDRGLAHAMNKGIAMARGEVIGWLNADDRYEPGALLAAGRAFAEHPGALWVTGLCRIVDGEGREIRRFVKAYKRFLLRRYSRRLLITQNFIQCPATFIRADGLRRIGPLDERFGYSMDYDLWLRLAKLGDPVVVDEELAWFTMTEGTLSMSGFETQFREHAQNAREHGDGHPVAVAANAVVSRAIVLAYRAMRAARRRSTGA